MKAPTHFVSTISPLGPGRSNSARAATPSVSGRSEGTRAPLGRRVPLALVAALAVIASLAFGIGSASAAPPTVTIGSPSAVGYTSVHITGTIDTENREGFYEVEYSSDGGATWSPFNFVNNFPGGSGVVNISTDVTGLKPGTEYSLRIQGWTFGEEGFSAEPNPLVTTKPVAVPTVIIDPVTTFTTTTAHFSGKVETNTPAGPLSDEAKAAFKANWEFQCNPGCPGLSGSVEAEEGSKVISVSATGLEPNTHYEVTLIATNAGGSASGGPQVFTTTAVAPTVKSAPGASDGKGGYTLQGVVNAHNNTLSACKFEYGPIVPYAFSVPCSPTPGVSNKPITVEGHVTGLTPGATYHARLVVTSSAGNADGGDQIFVPTLESSQNCTNEQLRIENSSLALPECRAYEMVSPPNKAGGEAFFGSTAGSNEGFFPNQFEGESVVYNSIAANIANSGQGKALGNTYVADRRSTGWETIPNLNGPNGSLSAPPYELWGSTSEPRVFSADLQSSVWYTAPGGKSQSAQAVWLRNPDGSFTRIGAGNNGPGSVGYPAGAPLSFDLPIVGVSADLSHVVLAGQGVHTIYGLGVYEFVGTGNAQPHRIDVDNSGNPISSCVNDNTGIADARGNAVSSDGRVIVFTVAGGCGGANPPAEELWARIGGTASVDVSASLCTRITPACNAPAEPTFQGMAKDGSRIYFTTTQQLVNGDTDQTNDLYACDIPPGTPAPTGTANSCSSLTEVSGAAPGAKVDDDQKVTAISRDGSTVYFVAQGVLAANEDALGETATAGGHNLYVWRTDAAHPAGQASFVARLDSNDLGAGGPQGPQSTPDGRYLAFTTATPLVLTDTDNARDVYRYDAETEKLVRVSVNVFGTGGNGEGFELFTGRETLISNDGEAILFRTNEALSPLDGNGEQDLYLWKAGHVSLISTGSVGGGVSYGFAIDGSGRDIFFETKQQLVPSDGDNVMDVYDARVGGGFSFATPASCSGEACRAPASSPPATPNSPANRANGEGNVKPKKCTKGKVLRKGRCFQKQAKKHHKKKGKHQAERAASTDRGGVR